jgi:hypothetical protein
MRRLRILLTTGVTALLLGAGTMAAQSASAATHAAPPRSVPGHTRVITVHMHPMKLRDGKVITNGTGQSVGDCGLAQLILHAGASTYNLTLFSSAGGMGVGSYSVYTNGLFQVPTPGGINANSAAWTSRTQRVLDPGLFASVGWVSGWVWTANDGPCGYVVYAPWND